jgi:tellurite resistance protein TerC
MLGVFRFFGVPTTDQPRVLTWGVVGAVVMRLLFVLLGAELLQRFAWTSYVFAALLIIAAIRMAFVTERGFEGEESWIVRWVGKIIPVTNQLQGRRFVVRLGGRRVLTPLAMALVVIELSDILFAVDSVPAAFAITRLPWIVYAANMFAVLGLRSMFTVLSGAVDRLRFLDRGLAVILLYVGVAMATHPWVDIPTLVTLGVVIGVLALTTVVSILWPGHPTDRGAPGGSWRRPRDVCSTSPRKPFRHRRRTCRSSLPDSPFALLLPRLDACPDRAPASWRTWTRCTARRSIAPKPRPTRHR